MSKLALKIYDLLSRHPRWCVLSFLAITAILFALMLRLNFKEDIADFLPLDNQQQEALSVYQDISGANKILAIFQLRDSTSSNPDNLVSAIERFADEVQAADSLNMVKNLTSEFDLERMSEATDFVYANIPYFLTDADYDRIDSLMAIPGFVEGHLEEAKQLLIFPTSGLLCANLQKDPLNLFSPTVSKLAFNQGENIELYDGRIFTADMSRAIVMLESPYGNSETQQNSKLTALLEGVVASVQASFPNVTVHLIGGPTIAVGNAQRIKSDSILSITIALVLIVALLVIVFRKPMNILLIVVSVAWGWLFAMAMLSVVHNSVSLIVIGISSIILGIAVNYPLHMIAHMAHAQSMRQVLREIIAPLVIGNITTVGAFVALVPLKAAALRDLGIFSAFILVGTILFVVVYLPHIASFKRSSDYHSVKFLDWLSDISLESHRWIIVTVACLTIVFAFFSSKTSFDADMTHINYMTDQQKEDMDYFKQFTSGESTDLQNLYVVAKGSSWDEALQNNLKIQDELKTYLVGNDSISFTDNRSFLPPTDEQQRRLHRWATVVSAHKYSLVGELHHQAEILGFQPQAFAEFEELLGRDYQVRTYKDFAPLYTILANQFSIDSLNHIYRIVSTLQVPARHVESVKGELNSLLSDAFCFDVKSMNAAMARGLSDNFNYIGWACGIIVFLFLWMSFQSIELAMLSFLPMALSWIWITGIMGILDIRFNIVNIILATFIFGQGDDYTIFITEGCSYEYAYRKKMVASFKRSIMVSALIMFIGIGTLIFAEHPALHSLAEVTIIGMATVVLMAWLLPPVVFNWITRTHGHYRKRPLRLGPVLRTWFCGAWWLSQLCIAYFIGFFLFVIGKRTARTELWFHKFVTWSHRLDQRLLPGVKIRLHNRYMERFEKPCVIISNHQSMLDPMFFMALNPKIIIVANERSSMNPVVRIMFRWLGFYTIRASNFTAWKDSSLQRDIQRFRDAIAQGYSIAFFPEGLRNPDSSVVRCHKGPFYLATQLGVDVLPVLLHGVNHLMPKGSFACYSGDINIQIGKRITPESPEWSEDYSRMTKRVHHRMVEEYNLLRHKYETAEYFQSFVVDCYRYKGTEIVSRVKSNMKKHNCFSSIVNRQQPDIIVILNCGYGEAALTMSLVHPCANVYAYDRDYNKLLVAKYASASFAQNVKFLPMESYQNLTQQNLTTYDLENI